MNCRLVAILLATPMSILLYPSKAVGQEGGADTSRVKTLKVFLDCQTFCDFDHFRREIAFVDYMRDRRDAQVHVLVTSQRTGAGGQEFTFAFIGLGVFEGRQDTLIYASSPVDTPDEIREGQTKTLQIGLMRYIVGTPLAKRLSISYRAPAGTRGQQTGPQSDPWNLWVFRVGVGGNFSGEETSRVFRVNGSFRASRITEDWKFLFRSRGSFTESRFDLSDGSEFVSTSRNYNFSQTLVRSLGDHWSVGERTVVSASTFVNQDLAIRAAPAIEYDVYPYGESTRRQLTVLYTVGVVGFNFEEITLFDKTSEVRPEQRLELAAAVTQPWGSVNSSLVGSSFLDDPSLHRIDFFTGLSIRIVRGLDFNLFGSVARIKNQIFLSGADIPDEERLIRRRQLGTEFRYRVNINFSYTFGSIFNNVVNPRLNNF
ncbi:MAG: hypothetical protein ACE5HT_02865 [Gemmatimonadales bacterium]